MMSLTQAAQVLNARLQGSDVSFSGVSTDTRTLESGDLFVALRGERFDGHAFLGTARDKGAAAALVDTRAQAAAAPLPMLVVDDTRLALGRLAASWRARFAMPLVALTGSSGKTTVKEMLASILRAAADENAGAVLATRGNLNNDIGVPLMLLELREHHRYAVIEMGMNHAGEIRYLTELAEPDVALVTNAGRAHIEFLGSEEAIARAKGEIFETLPAGGTAVINADDAYAPLWRGMARKRRCIDFGLERPANVTATFRRAARHSEVEISTPSGTAHVKLEAPGAHNVRNALAAAAAAVALEIPLTALAAGLERYGGVKGRLQMKSAAGGAALIDDTYNANPESMRAAIDVLAESAGEKVLVIGDMGELGTRGPALHAELGVYARRAGIDRMLAVGELTQETVKAFGAGARHFPNIDGLLAALRGSLAPEATVLVKGSRFMKMERVVAALESGAPACS
ncbi:MAG TPA: UDP-N-acetylmuramoyl-tripeptide--D-alanyl-D-alanine ligase [Burkholderiales bacterium]|nr:UDP-N-acetylmuramoyl-tripeptide--D-alanyl-D-alanine ligase [Burkholderiales bacterium]